MARSPEPESYYSSYNSYFIDETSLDILRDILYTVPSSETNVVLIMNIFDLKTVNPAHPTDDPDGPTDVIFFGIRFVVNNTYQPIGGVLIYSDRDQSDVIADCIRRCHRDLYEMGVQVLCSVSPHYKIFKNVIRKLNPSKNFDEEPDAMYYPAYPNINIIHLYDVELMMNKFHRVFMQRDIEFKTKCGPPYEHLAIWADVFYTLYKCSDFNIYLKFFYSNVNLPRQIQFVTQTIWLQYMELKNQGELSSHCNGVAVLFSALNAFMGFLASDFLPTDSFEACWREILYTLENLVFVKPELSNIPKETLNLMRRFKESQGFVTIGKEESCQSSESVNKRGNVDKKKKANAKSEDPKAKIDSETMKANAKSEDPKAKIDTETMKFEVNLEKYVTKNHKDIRVNKKLDTTEVAAKKKVVAERKAIAQCILAGGHPSVHCENKNCTGCVVTVDIKNNCNTERLHVSSDEQKSSNVPLIAEAVDIELPKSDNGCIKKITSKKKKKKKSDKKEQNPEQFSIIDKLVIDLLEHDDAFTSLDQQWEFINKFKQVRLTREVTSGPNGENCTLPCVNGKDVLWEESLDIETEQETALKDVLCTVKGLHEFISMLLKKNILRIKSDSILTQPLEEMVTKIQRDYNKMKLVYYFGRPYKCLDPELISFTLDNSKSLYLIKKD